VRTEPGTGLRALLGGESFTVSSTHFQGIVDAGPRLQVAARSDDGLIEAIELPGPRFVIGLQWHPEWEPLSGERSLAPFRALVRSSSK
jgi:putative glutamine amidotransferase